jgi:hypothetical protein
VGFSSEVEQALAERFSGDSVVRARAILQTEQPDRVLLAVLALSEGDLDRLAHFSQAATVDPRDVLYWAENPPEGDEPRSYEELRQRLGLPPDA